LQGVDLRISGVSDGQTFSNPAVQVSGQAKNARNLSIDGRPVLIDRDGYFQESLILAPGYNIMTFKASDKFGKYVEKNYQLNLD
jgi:hypothetical protein